MSANGGIAARKVGLGASSGDAFRGKSSLLIDDVVGGDVGSNSDVDAL